MSLATRQLMAVAALLVLVLGISGCVGVEPGDVLVTPLFKKDSIQSGRDARKHKAVESIYECEPKVFAGWQVRDAKFHEGFLQWSPDARHIAFHIRTEIRVFHMPELRLDAMIPPMRILAFVNYLPPAHGFHADLSPNGSQVVYSTCGYDHAGYEIAVVDVENGERQQLTMNRYLDHYPVWSPDGKRIAFISEAEGVGTLGLYTMAADGTDMRRIAPTEGRVALAPPVWSPDGERLAFVMKSEESDGLYLHTVRNDGSELTKVAETSLVIRPPSEYEFAPAVPAWSPDGRYLTFIRGNVQDPRKIYSITEGVESEEATIYIVRTDGTEPRQVLTLKPYGPQPNALAVGLAGGTLYPYFPKISQVLWSPDGKELLFFANGAHLINIDGSNLRRLSPPVLDGMAAWSPDGKRIAVYEMGNAESPQVIWTAEGHFRTLEHKPGERVLLTVARDGSDLQTLIEGGPDSYFLPVVSPAEASVDLGVCTGGTVVSEPAANPGLVADCEALLQSRDMLSNTLNLKWNAETPLAEWEGVTLGGEPLRVHELGLERMNGALPPELGQLSELRHLEIRGVGSKESRHIGFRLSGGIPAEIGNLQNLEVLDLSGNFLTGFIPAELSGLQRLETLWLEDNFLSGAIPPELSALASLRYLNLGRNNLSGGVPAELGSLSQLQELHLWSNQLTGGIPPELGNLTQLQRLSLSVNRLSGEIPPELGNLSQLTALWLSSNRLTGSIPPEMGNLTQLVNLYLTNNQLTGSIPAEMGNLLQLERLHLSYNQLSGSIPPELSNLLQLRWLELSANAFSGCVAAELPDIWVRASGLERCA